VTKHGLALLKPAMDTGIEHLIQLVSGSVSRQIKYRDTKGSIAMTSGVNYWKEASDN
jgi:hypothetical protein